METATTLLCSCALLACLAAPAQAQITKVNSRAALAGDVTIDWQAFGPDGSFVSTPAFETFGPETVSVASSSGGLLIRREGTTWHGDFTPGEFLMTQPYQSDNFIVAFSPPVAAVGTQIDPGGQQGNEPPYTGHFTARLCLYAANNAFLGTVQTVSIAKANETGSARFIGARSSGTPISYVVLLVSGVTPGFTVEGDLAANRMAVATYKGLIPPPSAGKPRPTACE